MPFRRLNLHYSYFILSLPASNLFYFIIFRRLFYPMARPAKPRKPSAKADANNAQIPALSPKISQEERAPNQEQVLEQTPLEAASKQSPKAKVKAAPKVSAKKAAVKKLDKAAAPTENNLEAANEPASPKAAPKQAPVAKEIAAKEMPTKGIPAKEIPAKEIPAKEIPAKPQESLKQDKHNAPKQDVQKQGNLKQENPKHEAQKHEAQKQDAQKQEAQKQDSKPLPSKAAPAQQTPPPQQPKPQNEPPLPLAEFLVQKHGIVNTANVFANLGTAHLYEHILFLREGTISAQGALATSVSAASAGTDERIFIVEEPVNQEYIAWNDAHRPFEQTKFNALKSRIAAYLQGKSIYVQDCFVGSDTRLRLPFRIITDNAAQSLAARNLFPEAQAHELKGFDPRMTILCVSNFKAIPELDSTPSEAFAIIDFSQRLAIIGGSKHIRDIKNIAFTVMSYAMPLRKVLPLHGASLLSPNGDTTLLMGNASSGKTALALDTNRQMIGDDANAWGDEGIFNLESGILTRIQPSVVSAPQGNTPLPANDAQSLLHSATKLFGTVLENAQIDAQSRTIAYAEGGQSVATISRAALGMEAALSPKNRGGHPKHVILLVNDALGVLPPVARLTHEQAVFFFLSGYQSRAAEGTEKEPHISFNPCFGEVQMLEDPLVYANIFREKLRRNRSNTWLVNTGIQGEAGGKVSRMKVEQSRAILHAIMNGALQSVEYSIDAVLGLQIPAVCQGLPAPMLNPRNAWQDRAKFDKAAQNLVKRFNDHFTRFAGKLEPIFADALNPAAQQALMAQNAQPKSEQKPPQGKAHPQQPSNQEPNNQQPGSKQPSNQTPNKQNDKFVGKSKAAPTEAEIPSGLDDFDAENLDDNINVEPLPAGLFARTDAPEFAPEFHPTLESAIDAAFEGEETTVLLARDEAHNDDNSNSNDNNNFPEDGDFANTQQEQGNREWRGGGNNRFRGGRGGRGRGGRRR